MTNGTSIITKGVLTLRGSFQQKEIFNTSSNVTRGITTGTTGLLSTVKTAPPWLVLYFDMYTYAIVPVVGTLCYVMTRILF